MGNETEKSGNEKLLDSMVHVLTMIVSMAIHWSITVLIATGALWGFGYMSRHMFRFGTGVWCAMILIRMAFGMTKKE